MTASPPTARARVRGALALLALAAVTGCSTFTVHADREPGADFGRYRSFAWFPLAKVPPDDQTVGDRYVDKEIYEAIEGDLQRKGYAMATPDTADFLLTYRLLKSAGYQDLELPYTTQWHRGVALAVLHEYPDAYDRGTLMIDAVDRATGDLVWRGTASARLLSHTSYENTLKRARKAIEKTLADFPRR